MSTDREHEKAQGAARSTHWPAIRKAHLEAHPTCAACGGKENLEVHHKKPFHLHPDLELHEANLITLCEHPGHDCHFVFGHFYDWKQFNSRVVEDAAEWLEKLKKHHHPEAA